jgi:hypothetical protein
MSLPDFAVIELAQGTGTRADLARMLISAWDAMRDMKEEIEDLERALGLAGRVASRMIEEEYARIKADQP